MFFDIIIPTHGRPYLLKRAVKSIRRQKFDDVRLIIISDDPQSHALESVQSLLKPHDLFIQRLNATGPAASRNEGLKHVNAEFVLFLDDDDTYAENFLKDLHHALQTTQGDVFVIDFDVAREYRDDDYADVYKFERWYPSFESMDFKQIYVKNFIPNNAVVYRSNTLKNKQFNNEIGYEDWDFLLSVFSEFELVYLPVRGALVHKMDYKASDSRGAKTREDVLETAIYIYQKYPIVDTSLLKQRKELLESIGLDYASLIEGKKDTAYLDTELIERIEQGSMSLVDVFNCGDAFVKENRIKTAIAFYELWLRYHFRMQGQYFVLHQVGYLYSKLGQYERAVSYFRNVLSVMPTFQRSRYSLADSLLKLNRKDEARAEVLWLFDPKNNVEKENKLLFDATGKLLADIGSEQKIIEEDEVASFSKQKILIVCSHFYPSVGGLETSMQDLAIELVNQGYDVSVLTQNIEGRVSDIYFGVKIISTNYMDIPFTAKVMVEKGNYKACVLVQDPLGVIVYSCEDIKIPNQTKVFIQPIINSDGFLKWRDNIVFRYRLKKVLTQKNVHALTMTKTGYDSVFMQEESIDYTYIPNSVKKIKKAGSFREKYNINKDIFLILHVANLYSVKNHIGLIDSLAELDSNYKLVMIGNPVGSKDYVDSVLKKIEKIGESIVFVPGLSKEWISAAMDECDVVVLASFGEASPITILEAMSHGKPWIATPECGAVNDHDAGFVTDLSEFKEKLYLLKDSNLYNKMCQKSYECYIKNYSWSLNIKKWVNLIEG